MPQVTGDRFASQTLLDCACCPPGGRQFRTNRVCGRCGKALCLVCRPEVPKQPFLCPDCGGGPVEDTLHQPGKALEKLRTAGQTPPYWLEVLEQRLSVDRLTAADELVPE